MFRSADKNGASLNRRPSLRKVLVTNPHSRKTTRDAEPPPLVPIFAFDLSPLTNKSTGAPSLALLREGGDDEKPRNIVLPFSSCLFVSSKKRGEPFGPPRTTFIFA